MIPIYRAKKIDSDEWVEGYFIGIDLDLDEVYQIIEKSSNFNIDIDQNTLAIHFLNSSNTSSKEKRWYNMDEISNIIKEYEDGKVV